MRGVIQPFHVGHTDGRRGIGLAQQGIPCGLQRRAAHPFPILQAQGKSAGVAQPVNRWRRNGKDPAIGQIGKALVEGHHLGGNRLILAAQRPVFQQGEAQRRVLTRSRKAETEDELRLRHAFTRKQIIFDFLDHRLGSCLGCPGRQLQVNEERALIFQRHKGFGQAQIAETEQRDQRRVEQHVAPCPFEQPRIERRKTVGQPGEEAVEPAKKPFFLVVEAFGQWLQQGGTERRGESQRQKAGKQDGNGQSDGELAVDNSHRATHEGQRQKDRRKDQRDADNRPADLLHGLDRGITWRQAFFGHDPFDVLHDHDGVIDQDADGQHHAEQGHHVDREAEYAHHGQRADQTDRHHQRRNQRVADILQKQEHDQKHQHHRLDQGVHHLGNGDLDKAGTVVTDRVFDIARKSGRKLFEARLDRRRCGQGIGPRTQHDRRENAVPFGIARGKAVVLQTDFDARDIGQRHFGTVGIGT